MAHSSTDISSICGSISGLGSPQSFNYGDFNSPVPASAYRCQPKCFEAPPNGVTSVGNATYWAHSDRTFVTLWTYFSSTPWAKENQCSTIYDDYKPILSIPTEFSAMTPAVDVGDGITCSFEFNSEAIFYDPPSALAPAASLALPSKPKTNAAQSTSISPITPSQGPEPSSVPTPSVPKPTQSTTTQGQRLGTDTTIDPSGGRLSQPPGTSESSQHQSGFSLKTRPANTDLKSYEEASDLASFPALDLPTSVALTGNDDSPTASPDPSKTDTAMPLDPESYTTAESHLADKTTDIYSGNAHNEQSHGSSSDMMTSSANVAAIIATILGAVQETASGTSTDPQESELVEASRTDSIGRPIATDVSSSKGPEGLVMGSTETLNGHESIDPTSMDPPSPAQHFTDTTRLVTKATSAIAFGAPCLAPGMTLQPGNAVTISGSTVSFDQSASVLVINGVTQSVQSPRTSASNRDEAQTLKDTATATATTTTSHVSSQDQRVPGASTSSSASRTSSTETAASTESSAGQSLPLIHAAMISLSVAVLVLL
ncbi:hypothetical protein KC333_g6019 [Hortaea werneckii]|nr:hypothetical protein KC333_g6019 [Hortaea werneckii]